MSKVIFTYLILIMSSILAYINTLPRTDRSREMVNFVGYNLKLARTFGQISFLIDCRSLKIMPKFILNRTSQIRKNHTNRRITSCVNTLQKTMLNEEIRDAFRRKAFLLIAMSRSAQVSSEQGSDWGWLVSHCKKHYSKELTTVKQRLSKKLVELCEKAGVGNFDITRSKTHKLDQIFTQRITDPESRKNTNKQGAECRNLPSRNGSDTLPSEESHRKDDPSASTTAESNTTGERKEPRIVNLSKQPLNNSIQSLLEKGPNYALTNRVTPTLMQSIEVGIERAFYGLKWKTAIETKQTSRDDRNTPQPPTPEDSSEENTPTLSPLPRPYFPDSGASQPPSVPVELERTLEKVKTKILGVYRGAKKTNPNHTSTQSREVQNLKEDENMIVKKSEM